MREPAVRDHYCSDLQHEVIEREQDKELSSYLTAVIEKETVYIFAAFLPHLSGLKK